MSAWVDRILREFPADLSRFWIACDPDGLLLDERIIRGLRDRGFEVLPFDDSVAFRLEYEDRFRSAWDRGESESAASLVLQLPGTDVSALPWDYVSEGRTVSLSLADLFPKLSYGVIRQVGSEHHESLFQAHTDHAIAQLGEGATKDFILNHIFRISPSLLNRPEDFWRELLRMHYQGTTLPPLLADHLGEVLAGSPGLEDLAISRLLASKSFALGVVQNAWEWFLAQVGVRREGFVNQDLAANRAVVIPFEDPGVRVIISNMFADGTLQPVGVDGSQSDIPPWANIGLERAPDEAGESIAMRFEKVRTSLPSQDSSHRDWIKFALLMGQALHRFFRLRKGQADTVQEDVRTLQRDADDRLIGWVREHFDSLPSVSAARGPVMLHHVPRYLSMRREKGEDRIALLVFDGLAIDQWFQIRDYLEHHAQDLAFEENACFAWIPTLSSVSRQALFSGLKPREFSKSIYGTGQDSSLWKRFWQNEGVAPQAIFYRTGLMREPQLDDLEQAVSQPFVKIAGIVVNMIDEYVHDAILGKQEILDRITNWCESGFVVRLLRLLTDRGYRIYITSDHGNAEAEGIGQIQEGDVTELRGARVRVYRSDELADSQKNDIDVFRLDLGALPDDYVPLYAGARGAFKNLDVPVVAHGGISVEELIVPFVTVSSRNENK